MILSFLKSYTSSGRDVRLNSRVVTFLICILISAFFWLLTELSKEYTIALNFPAKYVNFPKDKVISASLPSSVQVEIRSNGFNLLMHKFKRKRKTILIDIKSAKRFQTKNTFYLYTGSGIEKIADQFSNQVRIIRVFPDTLFFSFNKKITKKVPVKTNINLTFDHHFQQTDSIKLTPELIEISGAAEMLEKINHLQTVPVNLKKVDKPQSLKLDIIIPPSLKQVELSQTFVNAAIDVARFTEGSVELPVEVENLPPGYGLKTFPDKITIKYDVAFNDYENINAMQFRAIVDYTKIDLNSNKLKVELVKCPSEVRSVKLNPEKVEYIIRK